jgi:hypothetical protein
MKLAWFRFAAIGVAAILLTAAYKRTDESTVMVQAAQHFLDSLSPEQKERAQYKFEDEERFDWHFIPKTRKGLAIREMMPQQREMATALLAAGLSQTGFIKAENIMSLDQILLLMEGGTGPWRDPQNYYVTIFGDPKQDGTWGYRFEGHHISQNYTIVNGRVVDAPSFFGANPAEVRQGPRKGLRTLAAEDDYGYEMVNALDDQQKQAAIVDKTAYKDIITMASREAALNGQPNGLSAAKMNADQYEKLISLIEVYADNVPPQMAQARMQLAKNTPKAEMYFAWSGSTQRGDLHYYRVQSPVFLIELDNTQNGGNHIHSVWRDYKNDWGADLLKAHYQSSHNVK